MRFYTALLACSIVWASSPAHFQAQGTDIVRGKVTSLEKKPIPGASVTITAPQAGTVKTARTNQDGLYTALFTDNEDEYVVTVKAIGYAPRTFRVERVGDEAVLVGNIQLKTSSTTLDVVTIEADVRPRPNRGDQRSVGGNERDITMNGRFLENPGDLAALAASIPGVTYIPGQNGEPGSFSVLGVAPDQNRIVVDGTGYDGVTLPQDAIGRARLVTSSFDPSRGQFAGASLIATTRGGRNTREGTARFRMGSPTLTWTDPALGTPESNTQSWSGSIGGPIKRDKLFYFGALQFDRRASGLLSIVNASDATLDRYGILRDTVNHLSSLLSADGVPLTASGAPANAVNGNGSLMVKFDFTPSATTTVSLRNDIRWTRNDGNSISAFAFPSSGAKTRSNNSGVQFSFSKYFDKGFLNELRSYATFGQNSNTPYLSLSGGQVLITSVTPENTGGFGTGVRSLRFGGNTSARSRRHTMSWETTNETSWLTTDSRHQFKIAESITITREKALTVNNLFGNFTFNSLADLAAGTPASFTRTLSGQERTSNSISGGLSLGDTYRIKRGFQMQYGFRIDAARPGSSPRYNPTIDSLFGMRTDRVPRDLGVSPRLGFSWTLGLPREGDTTSIRRPGGNTAFGGGFGGERFGRGDRGRGNSRGIGAFIGGMGGGSRFTTLSGGIGAFRGTIASQRITAAVAATGLPNTTTMLSCIGAAAPNPDWDLYLSNPSLIPTECLDGTAPTVFSSLNPNVIVFDPGFRAPVSWRANLNFSKTFFRWLGTSTVATYSLNMNEASSIDLNLNSTPSFFIASEGNRPVFVPSSAIVTTTGAVASLASRNNTDFNRVMRYQSDMKSAATQFIVSLYPQRQLLLPLSMSYTNSFGKARRRGFETSTAGDPFTPEWGASTLPRHQITLGTSFRAGWLSIGMAGNLTSGLPYTPLIAGDINGDGYSSNDRAFIFNPDVTADAELSSQMRNLLSNASGQARDCLKRQLSTIAGAESCRAGWTVQPNLSIGLNPNRTFNVRNGLQFSVLTVNAAGAIARLVGLENSFLGQSSFTMPPDPTLLYVTGFDPVTRNFKYRVNENFGDARNRRSRSRFQAPFQILLQGELRVGGPVRPSFIQALRIVTEGDSTPSFKEVQTRLSDLTRGSIDAILTFRDSLLMTSDQVSRLEELNAKFRAEADSTMGDLAQYVVEQGKKLSDDNFIRRLQPKQSFLMRRSRHWLLQVRTVLTLEQWNMLPGYITGEGNAGGFGDGGGGGGGFRGNFGGRGRLND